MNTFASWEAVPRLGTRLWWFASFNRWARLSGRSPESELHCERKAGSIPATRFPFPSAQASSPRSSRGVPITRLTHTNCQKSVHLINWAGGIL